MSLVPTRVANTTQTSYDVTVFPVLLTQGLSGAFAFSEMPLDLSNATKVLTPAPMRFTLAPGQVRTVSLRWNLLPLSTRFVAVGVVFQGVPAQRAASVGVVTRLLSINFLRLPGAYHSNGVFTGLHAIQFAPKVLRFLPRVKNTGDIVDSPTHGRLLIRDASGKSVYKTHWPGDVVLPGAQREFPIDVHQILPAGKYTAIAAMDFGANHNAKISTPFTLVGPNQLPTPAVTITGFNATGALGAPAHVVGTIVSSGTSPVSLDLKLQLFRIVGTPGAPLATTTVHVVSLAPKSTRSLGEDLGGKLVPGNYRVVGTYVDPTGAPQQLTADFQPTKHKSFFDRLKDFLSQYKTLLIILVGLLVLLLIAYLLRRQMRLQRALRDASAVAAPPAPPAASGQAPGAAPVGGVDLNHATAEQLMTLPGVGPKAAQRIIDHRDEYGRFASVEDLAKVEGFDAGRIAELRSHIRI